MKDIFELDDILLAAIISFVVFLLLGYSLSYYYSVRKPISHKNSNGELVVERKNLYRYLFYVFIYLLIYALINYTCYILLNRENPISKANIIGIYEAFTLIGSIFIGLLISLAYSWKISEDSKNELKGLSENIESDVEDLRDAVRKIGDGFLVIMTQIKKILKDAEKNKCDYLYILTYSLAFPYLFEEDPDFQDDLIRKHKKYFLNLKDRDEKKHLVKKLIFEESTEIRELLERLGRNIEDFHVTTLKTELLEKHYVNPMLNRELISGDLDEDLNISDFTESLNKIHNEITADIKTHRKYHLFNSEEISWHTEVDETMIPFQLIISGKHTDGKEEKEALIIYVGRHNIQNNEVANSVLTSKEELIDSFLSIYENISNHKSINRRA